MSDLPFDPSDYNSKTAISRVREYSQGLTTVDGLDDLAKAEAAWKNRKSVLDAIARSRRDTLEALAPAPVSAPAPVAAAPATPPPAARKVIGYRDGPPAAGGLRTRYAIFEDE